jgi:RNA polymerase sigma-70 factor (ECF subfamily)
MSQIQPHPTRSEASGPAARAERRDLEDQQLVERCATGEMRAFDSLFRSYHPRLTRFLDRMLLRQPALIEEVLNDTMWVVWRRADSYNGQSKVSTWIFGIAYRKALKALQQLDNPLADEDGDEQVGPDAGPEHSLGRVELHAALAAALAGLSSEHRAVIALTYFHGMDCAEVAAIAACPVGTVKSRMFHARKRLQSLLPGRREDWL